MIEVARTNLTDDLDAKQETMYWSFILGLLDLDSGKISPVVSILGFEMFQNGSKKDEMN